jgi:murein DD-endopeptidase MepM/ murein hydrolase activator NlpD
MQNKPSSYTFLLTHSNRNNIYIRRVEVSKKLVNSTASAALVVSIGAVGFAGFQNASFAGSIIAANKSVTEKQMPTLLTQAMSVSTPEAVTSAESKPANYERPEVIQSPMSSASSLGGPEDFSFRLTNLDTKEENEVEAQIRQIEAASAPENMPTMWATSGKINNEFSFRRNPFGVRSYEFHSGIDIDGEKGDIVLASGNGIVKKAGWSGGYGNLLEIDHGNGLTTRYGHLSRIDVKAGDLISRGQEVALVGSTGRSTGPHLHFEVRVGEKSVNPRRFLPREADALKDMGKK